jgi:ribosomal protein S18 acetylase RimI-like enzyme
VSPPRLAPDLFVREATEEDTAALTSFTCSTGLWFEREVEDFVRWHALRAADSDNFRLLVAVEGERVVATLAHHHPELLPTADAAHRIGTRLHHLAIAITDQGRRLPDRRRLSDALMQTLIADAIDTWTTGVLTAIVAVDNDRSLAMCDRNGLRSRTRHGTRYVRVTGLFERIGQPLQRDDARG